MGLKAVAIYRDNCKVAQPLSMAKKDGGKQDEPVSAVTAATEKFVVKGAVRREMPRQRRSRTYEFRLSDLKGFFTVGEYEDGTPGEVFINVSKQGSTLSGLMDSFAISVSHGLQYGVPLKSYVKTLRGTSFAPSGITDDAEIRTASSITDYIVRRLAIDYLSFDDRLELGLASFDDMPDVEQQTSLISDEITIAESKPLETEAEHAPVSHAAASAASVPEPTSAASSPAAVATALAADSTAPLCYNCGNQTQRAGSCYVCSSCGSTTGCS